MKAKWMLLIFVLSAGVFAQGSSNWGERILFGTEFTKTDSLKLRVSSLRDTVLADTLYSGVLDIKDYTEGIYTASAWFTNVGGTSDSLTLDVRMVKAFRDKNANTVTYKFSAWSNVFNVVSAAALQDTTIDPATSSWWRPASGRQYRLYDKSVTTDTTNHIITDYVR